MASLSCIRKNSKPWQGGKSMLDTVKKVRRCSRPTSPSSFLLTGWEKVGQQQQVCMHFVLVHWSTQRRNRLSTTETTLTYMLFSLFNISCVMKSCLPFLTGDHCWQLIKPCNIHKLQCEQRFTDPHGVEMNWVEDRKMLLLTSNELKKKKNRHYWASAHFQLFYSMWLNI